MNIDADLAAVHSVLIALINPHPDRQRLRGAFESISSQMHAQHMGRSQAVRDECRQAVERYLQHFDLLDATGKCFHSSMIRPWLFIMC